MKLVYDVKDKPSFGKTLVFALQQLLAIMAATIAVPMIISGSYDSVGDVSMSTAAALFGAFSVRFACFSLTLYPHRL